MQWSQYDFVFNLESVLETVMTASSLIAVVFRKVLPLTQRLSDSENLIVLDSPRQKTPPLPFLQFQNGNW